MKVLIACEYSGIVRDAFIEAGHNAISCDLLPTERPGPHIQGDVRELLRDPWDLVIAHPPCSYLTNYNAGFKKWNQIPDFWDRVKDAVVFFNACLDANAPAVCVENPMPLPYVRHLIGEPFDRVEPYEFGEPYRKRTWLWGHGLPPLMRTLICSERKSWVRDSVGSGAKRYDTLAHHGHTANSKLSARFWPGIATAMARQWGSL